MFNDVLYKRALDQTTLAVQLKSLPVIWQDGPHEKNVSSLRD